MPQNEAYVDLSYRGLSLGRRIKLTQVRPSTGYLEHPTPMPVGTPVSITTDNGMTIDAVVTHVHEQVGGSDRAPGMIVKPALADEKLVTWWKERVSLPELEAKAKVERAKPVTVRPRSHTVPNPVAMEARGVAEAAPIETTLPMPAPPPMPPMPAPVARIDLVKVDVVDEKKTTIMDAVDQELLEQLSRGSPGEIENLVRTSGEHPVIDDGQRTTLMDAVDPAALGLDVNASGSMPSMGEVDDDGNGEDESQPIGANGDKKPSASVKKRRKKRR